MSQSDFTYDELVLRGGEWMSLSLSRRRQLMPGVREWLDAWDRHDRSLDVRNDDERRFERRGHYCGWFAARGLSDE